MSDAQNNDFHYRFRFHGTARAADDAAEDAVFSITVTNERLRRDLPDSVTYGVVALDAVGEIIARKVGETYFRTARKCTDVLYARVAYEPADLVSPSSAQIDGVIIRELGKKASAAPRWRPHGGSAPTHPATG